MKKSLIFVSLVGLVLVSYVFISSSDTDPGLAIEKNAHQDSSVALRPPERLKKSIPIPDLESVRSARQEPPSEQDYVQQMIVLIKQELGPNIQNIAVQAGLKEFKDDLLRAYPQNGLQMFEQIVRAAFPDLADRILEVVALMDSYEDWLLAAMLDLNQMDLAQQQEALWEKRYALFNEDARLIWPEELSFEEEREESVRQTIAMLDQAHDLSMDERLALLQSTFAENYDGTATNLVVDTTGVMTQVFFRFESVQKELGSLSNEERQTKINDIRRQFGIAEEMIDELAARDQEKEQRWQNGYAYMEQRKALIKEDLSEESLTDALASLRTEFFGDEAYTIGKEEDEIGFFRYERPRVYGWN